MMVAAVDAVQKGDAVAGPVGEAQAQRARIELNRLLDVAREQENMRQAPGRDALDVTSERRAALARADWRRPKTQTFRWARISPQP